MGRSLRQNSAGIYHLVNRGVGLREVFLTTEDKLFFIQLICNNATHYQYVLHAYALINNGYNMLIETQNDNLSSIMKLLNARYTVYFNKKYGRRGHLWEGRFKSWYITNESLLLDIVAYIEHLPVYTKATKTKESSYYSSYRQFMGLDQRLSCLKNSIVFKKFNDLHEIEMFFDQPIDIKYINDLHEKLKQQNKYIHAKKKILPTLKKSIFETLTKEERNQKIYLLYKEGYTQSMIGKTLNISQQAVHNIIKKIVQI